MACIELPQLPLQLVLQQRPQWRRRPTIIVDRDRATGTICWLNETARQCGIRRGMRYAEALVLASELRATVLDPPTMAAGREQLVQLLCRFSPRVEPAADEPGVFWLDAAGLSRLYPSLEAWCAAIRAALNEAGFSASIVVGFSRFGVYAVAHSGVQQQVFTTAAEEQQAAAAVPLASLSLRPALLKRLDALGLHTVGAFLRLPPTGLARRFGREAMAFRAFAEGRQWQPLQAVSVTEPPREAWGFDPPVDSSEALLAVSRELLPQLLSALAGRQQALAQLQLQLQLDNQQQLNAVVRPATPTLALAKLMPLLRLRLEQLDLSAGVVDYVLQADGAVVSSEQLQLFGQQWQRDLRAADDALALIRTEFGETSVVRAELQAKHLPEASFSWTPLNRVQPPAPQQQPQRRLIRLINQRPLPLADRQPDWQRLQIPGFGTPQRERGPYVVAGGWWQRAVHREYHFVESSSGRLLWLYYDQPQQRWFIQGEVD